MRNAKQRNLAKCRGGIQPGKVEGRSGWTEHSARFIIRRGNDSFGKNPRPNFRSWQKFIRPFVASLRISSAKRGHRAQANYDRSPPASMLSPFATPFRPISFHRRRATCNGRFVPVICKALRKNTNKKRNGRHLCAARFLPEFQVDLVFLLRILVARS